MLWFWFFSLSFFVVLGFEPGGTILLSYIPNLFWFLFWDKASLSCLDWPQNCDPFASTSQKLGLQKFFDFFIFLITSAPDHLFVCVLVFLYLFWRNVCSSPLSIFNWIVLTFYCWVTGILCMFWMLYPYQICDLLIFLPILEVSFAIVRVVNFDEVQFINFFFCWLHFWYHSYESIGKDWEYSSMVQCLRNRCQVWVQSPVLQNKTQTDPPSPKSLPNPMSWRFTVIFPSWNAKPK